MAILRPPLIVLSALLVFSIAYLLPSRASALDDAPAIAAVVQLDLEAVLVIEELPTRPALPTPAVDEQRDAWRASMFDLARLEPAAQRSTHRRGSIVLPRRELARVPPRPDH